MQEYEDLKRLVEEIEPDIQKTNDGNNAAGRRVRKQMQAIKEVAKKLRDHMLEIRTSTAFHKYHDYATCL